MFTAPNTTSQERVNDKRKQHYGGASWQMYAIRWSKQGAPVRGQSRIRASPGCTAAEPAPACDAPGGCPMLLLPNHETGFEGTAGLSAGEPHKGVCDLQVSRSCKARPLQNEGHRPDRDDGGQLVSSALHTSLGPLVGLEWSDVSVCSCPLLLCNKPSPN